MNIEIRLYKQYDTDLISLYEAGYSVSTMMKEAVISYANGNPVHYYIDEITDFKMGVDTKFRTRFKIPESDTKTIYMLKHLKPRYRNLFCKTVLRNALVQQNLVCFFTDPSLAQLQNINLEGRNPLSYKNLVPCSSLKEHRQFEFAGRIITTNNKSRKKISDVDVKSNIPNNPFSQNQNANDMHGQTTFINNFGQTESQMIAQPITQPIMQPTMQPTAQYITQPIIQQLPNQSVLQEFQNASPGIQPGAYTGLQSGAYNGNIVQNRVYNNVPNAYVQPTEQTFIQQPEIQPAVPTTPTAPVVPAAQSAATTPQIQTQAYVPEIEDESETFNNNNSESSSIGLADNDTLLSMFDNL